MSKDALDLHQDAADTLYGDGPKPLPERPGQLHSYSPAVAIIDQRGPELWAATGADLKAQEQLRHTFTTIQTKTGLPDGVVARIADGHIDGLLANARVSQDREAEDFALGQQIAAWNTELREQFTRTYGDRDGQALLDRTQRFVRAHPQLAEILRQRGLGSRPEIVQGIAAHVFSTGWR